MLLGGHSVHDRVVVTGLFKECIEGEDSGLRGICCVLFGSAARELEECKSRGTVPCRCKAAEAVGQLIVIRNVMSC